MWCNKFSADPAQLKVCETANRLMDPKADSLRQLFERKVKDISKTIDRIHSVYKDVQNSLNYIKSNNIQQRMKRDRSEFWKFLLHTPSRNDIRQIVNHLEKLRLQNNALKNDTVELQEV